MALITAADRRKKDLMRTVSTVTTDDSIVLKTNTGDDTVINKADFITVLEASGLGGGSSGSGEVIDCGDRMTGSAVFNCGTRV